MKIALRDLERNSIRDFVQRAANDGYLSGRVLDFGCGKQPYREIVERAGGAYTGYDRAGYPGSVSGSDVGDPEDTFWPDEGWDSILCTQVVQYLPIRRREGERGIPWLFSYWRLEMLESGGHLVLTYPTNWPVAEKEDLHRFTKAGMERLLTEAGFRIVRHELRAEVECHHNRWALGYGCIARA